MGNLYYGCKKCKGGISIFSQYVGFVKCVDCNLELDSNKENYKDSKFKKHVVRCSECSFTASFESMGTIDVACLKCLRKMFEGVINE